MRAETRQNPLMKRTIQGMLLLQLFGIGVEATVFNCEATGFRDDGHYVYVTLEDQPRTLLSVQRDRVRNPAFPRSCRACISHDAKAYMWDNYGVWYKLGDTDERVTESGPAPVMPINCKCNKSRNGSGYASPPRQKMHRSQPTMPMSSETSPGLTGKCPREGCNFPSNTPYRYCCYACRPDVNKIAGTHSGHCTSHKYKASDQAVRRAAAQKNTYLSRVLDSVDQVVMCGTCDEVQAASGYSDCCTYCRDYEKNKTVYGDKTRRHGPTCQFTIQQAMNKKFAARSGFSSPSKPKPTNTRVRAPRRSPRPTMSAEKKVWNPTLNFDEMGHQILSKKEREARQLRRFGLVLPAKCVRGCGYPQHKNYDGYCCYWCQIHTTLSKQYNDNLGKGYDGFWYTRQGQAKPDWIPGKPQPHNMGIGYEGNWCTSKRSENARQ